MAPKSAKVSAKRAASPPADKLAGDAKKLKVGTLAEPATKEESVQDLRDLLSEAFCSAPELSRNCATMLAAVVACSLTTPRNARHEYQRRGVELLRMAMSTLDAEMRRNIEEIQTRIQTSNIETQKFEENRHNAEAQLSAKLEEAKQKAKMKEEAQVNIKVAQARLQKAEAMRESLEKQVAKIAERKQPWEQALSTHFEPIKQAAFANATDAKKHLGALLPQCKKLGLEESFLSVLPTAVSKPLDARGSFDKMVVDKLEEALSKPIRDICSEIDLLSADREAAAAEAKAAATQRDEAKEASAQATQAIAALQTERSTCEVVLQEATQAVKESTSACKEARVDLELLQHRLQQFQDGPARAFRRLDERDSSKLEGTPEEKAAPAGA